MGIIGDRTSAADYDDDMRRAKDAGIDAFALNVGSDSWQPSKVADAYVYSRCVHASRLFIIPQLYGRQ